MDNKKSFLERVFDIKTGLGAVVKKEKNPFHKSEYADLNEHLSVVEPVVSKNGCILTQRCMLVDGKNVVATSIQSKDTGESIESVLVLPDLVDMQKLGGAITYARRYTLNALLAMRSVDDDGETAVGRTSGGKGFISKPKATKNEQLNDF